MIYVWNINTIGGQLAKQLDLGHEVARLTEVR